MLMGEPATFIKNFIIDLDAALGELKSTAKLSQKQKIWLGICLTGILLMNSVCWAKFERASLGAYKVSALSWMFRDAKIYWNYMLQASVILILKHYGIKEGVIAIDESDRARSKRTKRIHHVHKQKHKTSGGYVNGQTVVLLLLVTESISVPVGFSFYMPDPALTAWNKKEKQLKKSGIVKKDRPSPPERNPLYPTKTQIALHLLEVFKENHKGVKVTAILADALYGIDTFMTKASHLFNDVQVISQLRGNQNIEYKGKKKNLKHYFNQVNAGVAAVIQVRGGKKVNVTLSSARLKVSAHGKKRFVIALKYEGESDYRY